MNSTTSDNNFIYSLFNSLKPLKHRREKSAGRELNPRISGCSRLQEPLCDPRVFEVYRCKNIECPCTDIFD